MVVLNSHSPVKIECSLNQISTEKESSQIPQLWVQLLKSLILHVNAPYQHQYRIFIKLILGESTSPFAAKFLVNHQVHHKGGKLPFYSKNWNMTESNW
jgi:hypothetical protein